MTKLRDKMHSRLNDYFDDVTVALENILRAAKSEEYTKEDVLEDIEQLLDMIG